MRKYVWYDVIMELCEWYVWYDAIMELCEGYVWYDATMELCEGYVWYDVIMELCEEILCMIWFYTGIMWENMYDDVMIELCE